MGHLDFNYPDSSEAAQDILTVERPIAAKLIDKMHKETHPRGTHGPVVREKEPPETAGEAEKDIVTAVKKRRLTFRKLSQIVERRYTKKQKPPEDNQPEDVGEAYKDVFSAGESATPVKTTTAYRSRGRSMAILGKASQVRPDMSVPAVKPVAAKQKTLPKVRHPLKPYDSARVIQHERLKEYNPANLENQGELAGKSAQVIPDTADAANSLLVRKSFPATAQKPALPKVLKPAQKPTKVEGLEAGQKKTEKEAAYMHGFLDKCAALNADLDHLFKYGYEQWAAMPPPSLTRSNYYSDTGRSATVGSNRTPRTAGSTPSQRASSRPAQNRSYQQSHSTGQQQNAGGGGSSSTTTNNAPRSSAGTSRTQRVGQEHTYRATRTETRTPRPAPQPRRRRSWLSAVRHDSPDAPWLAPSPMSTYNQAPDHQDAGYEPMDLGGLLGALVGALGGSEGYSEAPAPMFGGGGGDAGGGGDGGGGGE
jgi:hypothetical protein